MGRFLPTWGIYLRLSSSFFLRSGFLFFSGFFLFVGFWHFELVARVEHVGILQLWISLAELVGAQTVTVGDAFERFAFTHAVACWTGIFLLLRFSLASAVAIAVSLSALRRFHLVAVVSLAALVCFRLSL